MCTHVLCTPPFTNALVTPFSEDKRKFSGASAHNRIVLHAGYFTQSAYRVHLRMKSLFGCRHSRRRVWTFSGASASATGWERKRTCHLRCTWTRPRSTWRMRARRHAWSSSGLSRKFWTAPVRALATGVEVLICDRFARDAIRCWRLFGGTSL